MIELKLDRRIIRKTEQARALQTERMACVAAPEGRGDI